MLLLNWDREIIHLYQIINNRVPYNKKKNQYEYFQFLSNINHHSLIIY